MIGRFAKRALDISASVAGIVVLSPVLLGCAVAVAWSSPGPVFFRQRRVGRGGHSFWLVKFRSMTVQSTGSSVTVSGDPRVTSVGRVLRRSKLDELPQLWNVLRGEMSLVGPRPEVPEYVDCYPDRFARILVVRPGLTDYASLEFRDEEQILAQYSDPYRAYVDEVLPRKLTLAEAYVRDVSFVTDIRLIGRTLATLVSRR